MRSEDKTAVGTSDVHLVPQGTALQAMQPPSGLQSEENQGQWYASRGSCFTSTRKKKTGRACALCGKSKSDGLKLQACAACKAVCYCGRDCQRSHWPTHKAACGK